MDFIQYYMNNSLVITHTQYGYSVTKSDLQVTCIMTYMIPMENSDADYSEEDYGLIAAVGTFPSHVIDSGTELDKAG